MRLEEGADLILVLRGNGLQTVRRTPPESWRQKLAPRSTADRDVPPSGSWKCMAMPRTLSFWPSEAIGLPPPSEKRPTSGTGAANCRRLAQGGRLGRRREIPFDADALRVSGAHLGVGAEDPVQSVDEVLRLGLLRHRRHRGECHRQTNRHTMRSSRKSHAYLPTPGWPRVVRGLGWPNVIRRCRRVRVNVALARMSQRLRRGEEVAVEAEGDVVRALGTGDFGKRMCIEHQQERGAAARIEDDREQHALAFLGSARLRQRTPARRDSSPRRTRCAPRGLRRRCARCCRGSRHPAFAPRPTRSDTGGRRSGRSRCAAARSSRRPAARSRWAPRRRAARCSASAGRWR